MPIGYMDLVPTGHVKRYCQVRSIDHGSRPNHGSFEILGFVRDHLPLVLFASVGKCCRRLASIHLRNINGPGLFIRIVCFRAPACSDG